MVSMYFLWNLQLFFTEFRFWSLENEMNEWSSRCARKNAMSPQKSSFCLRNFAHGENHKTKGRSNTKRTREICQNNAPRKTTSSSTMQKVWKVCNSINHNLLLWQIIAILLSKTVDFFYPFHGGQFIRFTISIRCSAINGFWGPHLNLLWNVPENAKFKYFYNILSAVQ